MLKIIIGSLFTKSEKYATHEKIRGTWTGWDADGEANLFFFES